MTRPARLFASAAGKKVIRALEMGITLHPTGATRGFMWEIEDELGNRGWVSSTCCSCPAAEICRTLATSFYFVLWFEIDTIVTLLALTLLLLGGLALAMTRLPGASR